MKKQYLFCICLLFSLSGMAQSISLSNLRFVKTISSKQAKINVTNLTSDDVKIKVRRVVNNVAPAHESNFCWDQCYGPSVNDCVNPVVIKPGQIDSLDFFGDLAHHYTLGTSTVKYLFYNADDETDSLYVTIIYNITSSDTATGVYTSVKNKIQVTSFQATPNPADNQVVFSYNLPENAGKSDILIYNMLGSVVAKINGVNNFGSNTLSTAQLPAGVYFYNLVNQGNVISSKKLVISHR